MDNLERRGCKHIIVQHITLQNYNDVSACYRTSLKAKTFVFPVNHCLSLYTVCQKTGPCLKVSNLCTWCYRN